jgi:hypothetical protein
MQTQKIAFENKNKKFRNYHVFLFLILVFFSYCKNDLHSNTVNTKSKKNINKIDNENDLIQVISVIGNIDNNRKKIKLSHAINSSSNEYLPILNSQANLLYFSAMDRTGFFDFKIDFTKEKSAGGEDIYLSELKDGIWADARPLRALNTNGHEVATCLFSNGDLLVTANYPENFGSKNHSNAGTETTDIFQVKKLVNKFQIFHFPEPINSIYTESDAWMNEEQTILLFVSDRVGNIGDYHKKGWKWNGSFWGNSDIYLSLKEGDNWSIPINLGSKINTSFAERTPFLSKDGLSLFLSSNGYIKDKNDLDVFVFKRTNKNDWSKWTGPYLVKDANSEYDDWGYKELDNQNAFLASSEPLAFTPTQGASAGDGGIRESNYRPGYEIFGLQIASLNSEFETNIYSLQSKFNPAVTINDVFFDFNSSKIKVIYEKYLNLVLDQIKQNPKAIIEINGYTDNIGSVSYNLDLSLKRAESLKTFIVNNAITNKIIVNGFGESKPIVPNSNKQNCSKNRRVEIYFR